MDEEDGSVDEEDGSVDEEDGGEGGCNLLSLRCCKLCAAAASTSEDGALDNSSCEISYPELLIILSCEGIRDAANPSSVPLSEICLLPSWLLLLLLIDGETCSLG